MNSITPSIFWTLFIPQAVAWNRDVLADKGAQQKPGAWRGVRVFVISFIALIVGAMSPLFAAMVL